MHMTNAPMPERVSRVKQEVGVAAMRAMLLLALAACGAGASGKNRLRVEPLGPDEIARIDAANAPKLKRPHREYDFGSWFELGDALYHVDSYEVSRVDPATGNDLWSVKGGFVEYDAQAGPVALWVR